MNELTNIMDGRQRREFEQAIDRYFSEYDSSQALASELIQREQHPTDLLILLCARLDALASDALGEDIGHRKAFCRFLTDYAGARTLFEAVSVPDLYYEIGYHRWMLEGTIPAPGRLHRFTKLDIPILHLIEDSGLPITLKDVGGLLDTLARILAQHYRVKARQPAWKVRTVSVARLKNLFENTAKTTRLREVAGRLPKALHPLLTKVQISNILYERFRCESIHSAAVRIDTKRFFSASDIYWKRIFPVYQGQTYELVEFPAKFLLRCLKACITGYRSHLVAKGKVPVSIHFHACDDIVSTARFLDDTSLPQGGAVSLNFKKYPPPPD